MGSEPEKKTVPSARRVALRTVIIYIVVGSIWILFSDRLLATLVPDPEAFLRLSTVKGWLFVLITAWILYELIQQDVQEIRKSEAETAESEERLARIVETVPSGILIINRDGIITFANAATEKIMGAAKDMMVGRHYFNPQWNVTEVGENRPLTADEYAFAQVLKTGKPVFGSQYRLTRSDGNTIYIVMNSAPLRDPSGRLVGVVVSFQDITQQKTDEERRLELEAHKREFYRRTIMAATEGKLIICEGKEIEHLAGPALESWEITSGEDLSRIRNDVSRYAEADGMDESRVYDFILSIGEATTNAVKHAGGGHASLHKVDDGLMFVIKDRGPGIEALTLPEVALVRGYSTAGTLGMGYKAIISVADKVYLATGPTGTTVAIFMKPHAEEVKLSALGLPDTWEKS
jgi:PAS domain S-box-containing protein